MSRKFAIYEPPSSSKLPYLVAIIKNGKVKDTFASPTLENAEAMLRKVKADGRGD
jgi:hypothetical protein